MFQTSFTAWAYVHIRHRL